jgi:hypothetical protein
MVSTPLNIVSPVLCLRFAVPGAFGGSHLMAVLTFKSPSVFHPIFYISLLKVIPG